MEHRFYIKADAVTKKYPADTTNYLRAKDSESNAASSFCALDSVSFSILEGERVGLIGANGAGKTTLLQIISGYSAITEGHLDTGGRVSAIMDIGTSLEMEMTGRENMLLAGKLYGKSRSETEALLPEMIDFIEIGAYIDQPVKTYSSGMLAKLAFSLISFVEPEILIIDEVLGVGDAAFGQKSGRKIQELCQKGKILLIVSHSMKTIREFTDRCIWLDQGRVRMDGDTATVTGAYIQFMREKEEVRLREELDLRIVHRFTSGLVKIDTLTLAGHRPNQMIFDIHDDIHITAELVGLQDCEAFDMEMTIQNMNGNVLMHNSVREDTGEYLHILEGQRLRLGTVFEGCPFSEGSYEIIFRLQKEGELLAEGFLAFQMDNNQIKTLSLPELYYENTITAQYI